MIFIIIIFLFMMSIYFYYENTTLKITNYKVINKSVPKDFNNYKIIQVSDFHNAKSKRLVNKIVEEISRQKPNVIAITGDLIHNDNNTYAIEFIKKINKIADIYYVPGNHEAILKDYNGFIKLLKNNNVNVLDNKEKVLKINKSEINLLGIVDPKIIDIESDDIKGIAKNSLDKLKYNKNNYSILLSHRPCLFDVYKEKKLDLVLTGHAHGGQIILPLVGGLYAPNQGILPKYTSGIINASNTNMIVSRGIGNSTFPFRVNNKPDLVIITLKNKVKK